MTMMKPQDEYHWFVTSAAGWVADENLLKALNRLKRHDGKLWNPKYVAVWRVPGPVSREYAIEGYHPVVENAELSGTLVSQHNL